MTKVINNKKYVQLNNITFITALASFICSWIFPQQYGRAKFTIMKPNLSHVLTLLVNAKMHITENSGAIKKSCKIFCLEIKMHFFSSVYVTRLDLL